MTGTPETTETRWLTKDEQEAWRAFVVGNAMLHERLGHELEAATGLTMADYELMVQLSESEGRRMRMSNLADRSLLSRSRLSHAVGRFEARGWVRREQCADDRRGAWAVLTDEGFAVLEAAAPLHVAGVREHLFDQLGPEDVEALARISRAIVAHLCTLEGADLERALLVMGGPAPA